MGYLRYSRNNRRQLLAADMAESLVIVYCDMMQTPSPEIMNLINECGAIVRKIQHKIYGGPVLMIKEEHYYRYTKALQEIKDMMMDTTKEKDELTLEYISGIIAICCDMHDELKEHSSDIEYIYQWEKVIDLLQKLYEHYDYLFTHLECMRVGNRLCERFYEIVERN